MSWMSLSIQTCLARLPNTNSIASITLLFPLPLGPTTAEKHCIHPMETIRKLKIRTLVRTVTFIILRFKFETCKIRTPPFYQLYSESFELKKILRFQVWLQTRRYIAMTNAITPTGLLVSVSKSLKPQRYLIMVITPLWQLVKILNGGKDRTYNKINKE